MPADYTYEVFISYKQDSPAASFVSRYFHTLLRRNLREELATMTLPPVFLDTEEIRPGQNWPLRLQTGVMESRVLVAVLTPSYFQSDWCMSEFASFEEREAQTQKELIVPVCYSNYRHVEKYCQTRQLFDLSRLHELVGTSTRPEDLAYLQELLIQKVAVEAARMILNAPAFNQWPVRPASARPRSRVELLGFGNAA